MSNAQLDRRLRASHTTSFRARGDTYLNGWVTATASIRLDGVDRITRKLVKDALRIARREQRRRLLIAGLALLGACAGSGPTDPRPRFVPDSTKCHDCRTPIVHTDTLGISR